MFTFLVKIEYPVYRLLDLNYVSGIKRLGVTHGLVGISLARRPGDK